MTRSAGAMGGSSGRSPANSGSTGIARCWRSASSWRSGRSSCALAGGHQLVELGLQAGQVPAHLLGRRDVAAPLLVERADEGEHLVARLLDHEVVERLADDAEEGEQRERRAHHDALAEGVVEQRRIVLVDEAGELLVGQEQQHVVDRRLGAPALVLALGQLLDPVAHVLQEGPQVLGARLVGVGLEMAQVRRHRELDVHVEHVALGQVEREVGAPASAAGDAAAIGACLW